MISAPIRSRLIVSLLLLLPVSAGAFGGGTDERLRRKLDSLYGVDQRYRSMLADFSPERRNSLARSFRIPADSVYSVLMRWQALLDKLAFREVAAIIRQHGYPGKSLVGTPTNIAAFFIIQHSDSIAAYLPLLQAAAAKGELPNDLVAMMEDRLLVQREQEQLYGTQVWGNMAKDNSTGLTAPVYYFNPIKDAARVNERRRQAGFETSIEEYAREMGVPYVVRRPWWWK